MNTAMLAKTVEALYVDLARSAAVPTDIACAQFACIWIMLLALWNVIAPAEVVALDRTGAYFVSTLGAY